MHIAFALLFFVFIGLCETLRHGVFGLSPSETTDIIYVTMALCALVILRGDIVFTLRKPLHDLYGNEQLNWTWSRSFLGLLLGGMLWSVVLVYGLAVNQITLLAIPREALIGALTVPLLLVALAQELFFREAVIKAYHSRISAIYLISALACFIFFVPLGVPQALIAAGAGIYYVTLRLIGTNILVVALVHGVSGAVFSKILPPGLTSGEQWIFSGYFFAASTILSFAVYHLFVPKRSVYIHA